MPGPGCPLSYAFPVYFSWSICSINNSALRSKRFTLILIRTTCKRNLFQVDQIVLRPLLPGVNLPTRYILT